MLILIYLSVNKNFHKGSIFHGNLQHRGFLNKSMKDFSAFPTVMIDNSFITFHAGTVSVIHISRNLNSTLSISIRTLKLLITFELLILCLVL